MGYWYPVGSSVNRLELKTGYFDASLVWYVYDFPFGIYTGVCCAHFVNLSSILSSALLLEAEHFVLLRWGSSRIFTFVDFILSPFFSPGLPFTSAGWSVLRSSSGSPLVLKSCMYVLEKYI